MNCCYLRRLLVSSSNFVLSVGKNEICVFQFRYFRTGHSTECVLQYIKMCPTSLFCFLLCFFSLFILPSIIVSFLLSVFHFFHSLFYHPLSAFCILSLAFVFPIDPFFHLKRHFSLRIYSYIAHFVLNTHFTCRHAPKSLDGVLPFNYFLLKGQRKNIMHVHIIIHLCISLCLSTKP